MPYDAHKNFSFSTVATAPSPATSGTSVTVQTGDGTLFPAAPFNVTIWPTGARALAANAEVARCTGKSGDVLTITRAQEGSTARSVIVGDQIAATITAKTLTDVEANTPDGWIDDTTETWTYASGSGGGTATFTVTGDVTVKYTVGTRIKLTQTTIKYFVVAASSFAAGTTTVTITAGSDYTLANAAISANFHSYAANPQGYPGWFNFAPATSGFSSFLVQYAKFSVVGNACTLAIRQTGTSNAGTFNMTVPMAFADFGVTNVNYSMFVPGTDNGATLTTPSSALFSSATNLRIDKAIGTSDGWTASGTKSAVFQLVYPI